MVTRCTCTGPHLELIPPQQLPLRPQRLALPHAFHSPERPAHCRGALRCPLCDNGERHRVVRGRAECTCLPLPAEHQPRPQRPPNVDAVSICSVCAAGGGRRRRHCGGAPALQRRDAKRGRSDTWWAESGRREARHAAGKHRQASASERRRTRRCCTKHA